MSGASTVTKSATTENRRMTSTSPRRHAREHGGPGTPPGVRMRGRHLPARGRKSPGSAIRRLARPSYLIFSRPQMIPITLIPPFGHPRAGQLELAPGRRFPVLDPRAGDRAGRDNREVNPVMPGRSRPARQFTGAHPRQAGSIEGRWSMACRPNGSGREDRPGRGAAGWPLPGSQIQRTNQRNGVERGGDRCVCRPVSRKGRKQCIA